MTWCVVHFIVENTVEVVPNSWIVSQSMECFWPFSYNKKGIIEAVKNKESPGCGWNIFKVKILGTFEDLLIAQIKCNRAKDRDDLSTSSEEGLLGKGLRFKTKKNFNDYDEGDDEVHYPVMPTVPRLDENPSKQDLLVAQIKCNRAKDRDDLSTSNEKGLLGKGLRFKTKKNFNDYNEGDDEVHYPVMPTVPRLDENPSKQTQVRKTNAITVTQIPSEQEDDIDQVDDLLELKSILTQLVKENKEFQRQVMRQLHILNLRVKEISENQEIYLKMKENVSNKEISNVMDSTAAIQEKMAIFPIENEDKLNHVEEILKNPTEIIVLAKELSRVGGASVKDITKRLMFQILTNEIGQMYSWEGQKGKRKFKELLVAKVVIKAVRFNEATTNATEADIIKHVKEWLVRSKYRQKSNASNQNRQDIEEEVLEDIIT